MEQGRNVYRLHSTPDLVIKLGRLSTPELENIDGHLYMQQGRLAEDIAAVEGEMARRVQPTLPGIAVEYPDLPETARVYDFPEPPPPTVA